MILLIKYILPILIAINSYGQIDDQTKHFYAGFTIGTSTALITNHYIKRPVISSLIGFSFGTLAGIAKECIYDKRLNKGTYELQDMFTTSWGSGCASIVSISIIINKNGKDRNRKGSTID
jgi:hypothetical protein